jgi:DNA-directed RNA polymerase subunit RPC12/RpoP
MPDPTEPICFQCGQSAAETRRLNRLEDGQACPTCSERLLATLRPLLPGFDPMREPLPEISVETELDLDFDEDQPA